MAGGLLYVSGGQDTGGKLSEGSYAVSCDGTYSSDVHTLVNVVIHGSSECVIPVVQWSTNREDYAVLCGGTVGCDFQAVVALVI